jgi:hypothetical protein
VVGNGWSSTRHKRKSKKDIQKRRRFCEVSSCDAEIEHRSSFQSAAIDKVAINGFTFVAGAPLAHVIIAVEIELAMITQCRRHLGVVIVDDSFVVMEICPFRSGRKGIRSDHKKCGYGYGGVPNVYVNGAIHSFDSALNCISSGAVRTAVGTVGRCGVTTVDAIRTQACYRRATGVLQAARSAEQLSIN